MKVKTFVLMSLSLIILSSCAKSPIIQYVDRVVYQEPVYPVPAYLNYPSVNLIVWGDYAIYKAQCEALIDTGNSELQSILDALSSTKSNNYAENVEF